MLVARTRRNQFPDNGTDNRSVPNLIDYQGKFTDDSSNPITGNVSIVFAIYADSTGGAALWTETHLSVEALDGLVHVLMGSETTFGGDLFDGSDRWLSINVNSDGEMTPRLQIVSVPYAIHANDSDNLEGNDSSYFMPASTDNWVDITGDTMTGNLVVNADFQAIGITRDSGGDAGASGQVLSSTVTGTDWIDATGGAEEINDLTDGKTDGSSVFLGSNAGLNDDGTNNYNVGVGIYALYTNTSGYSNTANGYQTLRQNSTGNSNTATGASALYTNSTGNYNTANGMQALYTNSTGQYNTANGANTLNNNTGHCNAAFGYCALFRNTTGEYNVGIGNNANYFNQTGSQNTIIGYGAGRGTSNHNKSGNVFLGYYAGHSEIGDNKLYIENSVSSSPLIYGEFDNDYVRINGDFQATGELRDSDDQPGTNGQVLSSTVTGTDWVDAISGDGHSLDADDGDPTDVVYVNNDGKVGINDTTPSYQLDVDGDINISSDSAYKIGGADILHNEGDSNLFVGDDAGHYNSGHSNAFMGFNAGFNNTDGKSNVFLGRDSGQNNTIGNYNSYIGSFSGYLSTGEKNIFVGSYSGRNTTGSNNVFLGFEAGYDETGSDKLYIESSRSPTPLIYGEFDNDKIVINGEFQATGITRDSGGDEGTGGQVLSTTGTGTDWIDVNVGAEEIDDLTDGKTGGSSVFLGSNAGSSDDGTSNYNIGVGISALRTNISGIYNTANGFQALYYNTESYNTALGSFALLSNSTGKYNVGIGFEANRYNQTGSQNTIIGYQAGRRTSVHNKSGNVFLGYQAGYEEIGDNKLYIENSDSSSPLIYGEFDNDKIVINGEFQATGITRDSGGDEGTSGQVLSTTGTGTDWVDAAGGAEEIDDLTDGKTGGGSVFLGSGAGLNDDGINNYNIGVGISALRTNISGTYNTANGYQALYFNTESGNTAFGSLALNRNTSGEFNVGIGFESNYFNQTGSQNTIIGYMAGCGTANHSKSGNVFLGYQAGCNETGDNKLYIDNSSDSTPLIYGEFDNDYVKINGDFEVAGTLYDDDHDAGTSGQVLSTTGTGTDWVDAAGGVEEINDLTDGKTGGGSVFLGSNAGLNDDGTDNVNVGVGNNTLSANISGIYNTANGAQALYYNTESYNSAFGSYALFRNTSGEFNVGVGTDANYYNQTGSHNTIIGFRAGRGTSLHNKSGNIFLGYNAGYNETGDNKLYIDNSSDSTPLIYGEFDNDYVKINGKFEVTENVSSPNSVIKGENTGTGYGVYGNNTALDGYGVYGNNTALDGYGVYGESTGLYAGYFNSNYNSTDTHVIHAEFTGTGYGHPKAVYGKSRPQDGWGYGGWFEGGYVGVLGVVIPTGSDSYFGVAGEVDGGSGTNYGIWGYTYGGSTNYAGYFSGNVTVTGTFTNPSDERFKENVQPFKNALSKIKLMDVHTFNFKQMEEEKQLVLPEGEQIGLIAHELEEILPGLVTDNVHAYDKNEGIEGAERDEEKIEYKGINYIGLIPVLIEAMKEQQQQIEELKQQIAELK